MRIKSKLSALSCQLSVGAPGGAPVWYSGNASRGRDAGATFKSATLRRFDLQFEVNDQAYFLNYVEDEGLWYVFRPTGSGVIRIPVEMEAVHSEHFAFAPEEGKKRVVH